MSRHLFVAGHILPYRLVAAVAPSMHAAVAEHVERDTAKILAEVCQPNAHIGPLLDTEKYDAHPDAIWHGQGICAACGSNVHRDHVRGAS